MPDLKKFDPKESVVSINNSYNVSGFASDFITGSADNDGVTFVEGAMGDVVANINPSQMGTITITLLATSPSVAFLNRLAKTKEWFSIWVAHKSLGERFGGSHAMVSKVPDGSYGTTVGNRVFTIKVADYTFDSSTIA